MQVKKMVIIRSHRPWPLRTIYTTKSLSLKTCHFPIPAFSSPEPLGPLNRRRLRRLRGPTGSGDENAIPVTKKWAWKRLLPFWYPVFADESQMIGKIVRRGCFLSTKVQTGFFAVRRSFFHSVKASIKQKVRVF